MEVFDVYDRILLLFTIFAPPPVLPKEALLSLLTHIWLGHMT